MSASSFGRLESDMAITVTMQDSLTRSHAAWERILHAPRAECGSRRRASRRPFPRGPWERECDSTRVESPNGVNRQRE